MPSRTLSMRWLALATLLPLAAAAQGFPEDKSVPSHAPLGVTVSWAAVPGGLEVRTGWPEASAELRNPLPAPGQIELINGATFYMNRGVFTRNSLLRIEIIGSVLTHRISAAEFAAGNAEAERSQHARYVHSETTINGRYAIKAFADNSPVHKFLHYYIEVDPRRHVFVLVLGWIHEYRGDVPMATLLEWYEDVLSHMNFTVAGAEAAPPAPSTTKPEWKTAVGTGDQGGGDQPPPKTRTPRRETGQGSDKRTGATRSGQAASPSQTSEDETIAAVKQVGLMGGAAAIVVAIAAGIASMFRSKKKEESEDENDEQQSNKTIGYVLQLSSDRFSLQPGEQATCVVTVWAVNPQGATSIASTAAISAAAPSGIAVTPNAGSGRLIARLTALDNLKPGAHAIAISATADGTSHSASVTVTLGAQYNYVLALSPATLNLQRSERTTVRARVTVTGPDPDHCLRETQRLAPAISFSLAGKVADWFTSSEAVEGDGKAGYLDLSMPDDIAARRGPHTATYTASVATPNGVISKACAIAVSESKGFELVMEERLALRANDVAGSLRASIHCLDASMQNADAVIAVATPRIAFAVSGPHAHWLREEGGAPRMMIGEVSGGDTPAKEVHPLAEAPLSDLADAGPFGATVTATVDIPRYGTFTKTAAVDIAPPEWFIEAVVTKQDFVLDGKDAAEFRVRLIPQQQHQLRLYGGESGNQLNQLLRVRPLGANAPDTVLTEVSGEAGFRTFTVAYNPAAEETKADYIDIETSAEITGVALKQPLRINLKGKPALKVSVDSVLLKAEGDPFTVTAEVVNPGAEKWQVHAVLKDTNAVTKNDPKPEPKIAVVLTPRALDESVLRAVGTLEFSASSGTQDLEAVQVTVTVQDEGLVLLTDPVTVQPDPKATKPGLLKLQVLRWSEEQKRLRLDRAAMEKGITFGDFSAATYQRGEEVFKSAGVNAEFQWFSGSGMEEYAVYKIRPKVPVPCDATAIDAKWSVSASSSGWDADKFERDLGVQFPADPSKAMEPKLAKEIANCKKMILLLPDGHRLKWEQKILAKDAPLLGYHGLYRMRLQIWEEARDALLRESQAYLQEAQYNDRIVTALEWSKWILDLAFQVVEGVAVPFPGNLAVDQIKAFITEYCVAACNEGTPVDKFAIQYFGNMYQEAVPMLADLGLGIVLSVDTIYEALEKRYPTEPIKAAVAACEIFWVGTFIQFLTYKKNPQSGDAYSIVDAALEATRALRDQIIVSLFTKKLKLKYPEAGKPGHEEKPPEPETKAKAGEREGAATKPADQAKASTTAKEKPLTEPVAKPDDTTKTSPDSAKASEPASVKEKASPEAHQDRVKEPAPSLEERRAAWEQSAEEGRQVIDQAHEAVSSGDAQKLRDAALDMQANKQGVYQINREKTPQAKTTREAINTELKKVYHETDQATCQELAKTHGDSVRAKSITNEPKPGAPPKDPSKMPVDRDVTYERQARPGELIPDPETPGMFVKAKGGEWVDIPAKESGKVYAEKFKEVALKDASPETKTKFKDMPPEDFAKRHDQTVTDRLASDAYGRGPKDLETAVSNPGGTFSDPAGMGKTAEYKANEWYQRAEHEARTPAEAESFRAEGMRQTTKQFGNQVEGRLEVLNKYRGEGSHNPDTPKVEPPPALKLGIDTMKKVADGTISPAEADAQLAKMGMTREGVAQDLGDFLAKIYSMPVAP